MLPEKGCVLPYPLQSCLPHQIQSTALSPIVTKMCHVEQNVANEIVNILLQTDLHPRGLAERLNVNHMTVARKLADLSKENVVDFRIEGKNKVYFLKKTIEARNAVLITEHYKLSRIIGAHPRLRGIVQTCLDNTSIPLAVLFGSYVKGTATKESDIDLYVETGDRTLKKEMEQKYPRLSVKMGAFDPSNLLIQEIQKNHVIVKGVERYYEKIGSFS